MRADHRDIESIFYPALVAAVTEHLPDGSLGARRRAQRLRRGDLPVWDAVATYIYGGIRQRRSRTLRVRPTPSFALARAPVFRLGEGGGGRTAAQSCARRSPHCATRTVARAPHALRRLPSTRAAPAERRGDRLRDVPFDLCLARRLPLLGGELPDGIAASSGGDGGRRRRGDGGPLLSDFAFLQMGACARRWACMRPSARTAALNVLFGRALSAVRALGVEIAEGEQVLAALSFTTRTPIWSADATVGDGWQPTAARRRTRTGR